MPPRSSPSPLLSSPLLIILFPIIISIILFYIIPQFLSLTSQLLRPTSSVKKSWDSLNVFLVIFAILCGVFAKLNDDASLSEEDRSPDISESDNIPHPLDNIRTSRANISESESAASLLPQQWFGYSDDRRTAESGGDRLRRSSSSYPDLRPLGQDSVWETRDHNKSQFHFFDDFEIGDYDRVPPVSHQRRPEEYSDVIKEIPVDTFVLHSSRPLPSKPSTPPTPPPPPPRNQKPRRTYQTVGRRDQKTEKIVNKNVINEAEELERVRTPPPTPPPPPPRSVGPPSSIRIRSEPKRRKSNVKKEIAMAWASVLSNQRKRKKQHKVTGTRNIYETAASLPEHEQEDREGEYFFTRQPPSPPPPPPPPPPPHSVFHNLFKKGMSKTKKVHSMLAPPTPPPPPPQPALRKHKSWNTSFPLAPPTPPKQPPPATSRPRHSASSGRPPLPTKANSYLYDGNVNSGCQSPLIPVAPPPPPPFKMPELKFFVRGDFVKIQSAQSSRCGSPELEDVDDVDASPRKEEDMKSQSEGQSKVNAMDGGGGGGGSSVFCPSPDVNTKADNFIARLKDEWRLEKMNSMRQKKKMP